MSLHCHDATMGFSQFPGRARQALPKFQSANASQGNRPARGRGRIAGVRASTPAGLLTIRSTLIVGADGRHSVVRKRAGLVVDDLGASIDVLWMRLSRRPSDGVEPLGRIVAGKMMVMINRGDYWQCAFLIAKGGADEVRARGLESFRAAIVELMPNLYDRVGEIGSWDDVKLLTVKVDRLRRWYR